MPIDHLTTDRKALAINLDQRRYGTFAEIGAGQEVVRWFFRVGGAAGTIAKSMSAYDMTVSDAIYGQCERYVCRQRLEAMLDHEQELNVSRLRESRGDTTAFFTFADTVSARNYKGTNECHGWMGVRFQAHPRDQASQIVLHVRMLDSENALQQEALGIVGVNLLYGAFFLNHEPDQLVQSLLDNLTTRRIEIDMIEFSGIAFRHVDNRVMSLRLVQLGLSNAAIFSAAGEVLQPSEVLHKKPILVERGSFRPVTHVNVDMLRSAQERFAREPEVAGEPVVSLLEITMHNLQAAGGQANGEIDLRDFLARADMLAACGKTVLISDYFEYYRLAGYLARYTRKKIGITMGAGSLYELFDEKYYSRLDGGILESFGRLFKNDLKLYIYPLLDRKTGELTTVKNLQVAPELRKLYEYLVENGCIEQLDNYNPDYLSIFSRDVLEQIKSGDPSWSNHVPAEVAEVIRRRGLLGHRRPSGAHERPTEPMVVGPVSIAAFSPNTAAVGGWKLNVPSDYNRGMSQHVDAVFENGVFRPEQPVNIANGERVSLTVDSRGSRSDDLADIEDLLDREFMASCRQLASHAPSLEEARQILGRFKGSLSDLIAEERDEP